MDEIDLTTPGGRLRARRRECGLSAETLGEMVGLTATAVRNQENLTNGIRPIVAQKYAEVLGVSPEWLLYGTGEVGPVQAATTLPPAPITLTADGKGNARLQADVKVPMGVALKIMALIEEADQ